MDDSPEAVELMREVGQLRWDGWRRVVARPAQIPHPTKSTSLYIGGRGSGKSRAGAEWLAHRICTEPGSYALIVPQLDHGITECLEQNLYAIIPERFRHWRGSVNQVEFSNGSRLKLYHAERPGKVRGPNLMGKWVDEPAEMRFGMDAWTNGQLATRIKRPNGLTPQTYVTGTPKRVEIMQHLLKTVLERPDSWHQSHGTMRENINNLSAEIVEELESLYAGTNLGMQELDGIMIEDVEGALLTSAQIQAHRADQRSSGATIVALSIDPGFSSSKTADEVGLVIGHRIGTGNHAIAEVLDDFSERYSTQLGSRVVDKCVEHGVSVIVFEGNLVQQWVKEWLEASFKERGLPMPRLESVLSRTSKWARAEPVAALTEKGRYRMVGTFARLESELTSWVPNTGMRSPNRLDSWSQLGRYFLLKNVGGGGVGQKRTRRIGSIG